MLGISEVAILIIIGILVFGAKKLPELARSAGKSARILKSEAKAMKRENAEPEAGGDTGTAVEGSVVKGADVPRT
ncbi:twin-arginine translocase TatA/TatE family subunit [Streptomyces sp. HNM0574]|uniref:twin-arginine translocase TatA/TatE family subunit n=1 Tax=Streptomyces sp. HNM0574 TaxID=2714954 RepID=UPI00146AFA2C|nr:Sec-independent protein translocase TatA [Streptomyces sp. HNM0574]